jgi:small-conductance mechanosensitive channel
MDFHTIWQSIQDWLEVKGLKFGLIILVTVFALAIARVVAHRLVAVYKRRHVDREHQKRADTLGSMFRYVLSISVFFIMAMLLLDLFDVKLGPMLAAAGVVGIAVGFGAQHLVQDVTNGFFIMLDDEIRVGDVVKAGGSYGTVERVGLRQTVLRSIDGSVHFIPNSKIDVVINMTKTYSYCLLDIGVAYREDVDEVISVMKTVEEEMRAEEPYSDWILEPIDILGLDEFAESALIIKARIMVKPIRQWKVKREYNRRLKKAFDQQGIEIPFPHVTLYMGQGKDGSAPPLFVKADSMWRRTETGV